MTIIKRKVELTIDGIKELNETVTRTTTGEGVFKRKITIGTTETTVTIPTDIGDVREVVAYNTDASNYVQWGYATGDYDHRIRAGDPDIISVEPGKATLYFLANTAAVELKLWIIED